MARAVDPRTTTRWKPEVHAWLVAKQRATGAAGLGTVVAAIVEDAMGRDEVEELRRDIEEAAGIASVPVLATSTQVKSGEGLRGAGGRVPDLLAALEESLTPASIEARSAAGVGTVPRGAAPTPSGVAPARRLSRLDVVVARVLNPGRGQIAPADIGAARRLIAAGKVEVSGRGPKELTPELQVGAGEVVVHQ